VLVWFNVVVPGHVRGVVTLRTAADAGTDAPALAQDAGHHCCGSTADAEDAADNPVGAPTVPAKKRPTCAVCFVAATYSAEAPFSFDFRPLRPTTTVDLSLASQPVLRQVTTAHYPTGPPTANA
jgi:hypothetical protein